MAAATGTVVISQGGSNFDSATFPRFVLGDGTNSLTFVIDNDARGLKLTGGADAENYSGASDLPFEDSQKTRLVVPTFDEADGAKKALLSFWITDESNFDDAFSDVSAINSGNITAITVRPHFCIRDAVGNEIKIGGGGKAGGTHTKADYESALSSSGYTLLGKYSTSGAPQFWLYKKDSAAEYFIYVNNEGVSGFRAHTVFGAALKHANDNSLINITTKGVLANGTLTALAAVGNNGYLGSEIHGLVLEYDTAGFAGNACYMEFKDPNTHFDTAAKRLCMSWGYSEYVVGSDITGLGRHAFTGATDDQFWGNNLNSKIWFRQGTIAGSGSDASLSTQNIAEAIKEMINGSYLGITATRSGSTVNLTNDTSGDSGNVNITTTNEGVLFSVTGMSGGGDEGGSEESEVARRTTIAGDQIALSASAGLAASSNAKSQLKLDISGSLAALGEAPAENDVLVVHDVTAGVPKKITVSELIGSVAAGSDTQVQFNDGGSALGGDSGLTFNKTTDTLTVGNDLKLASDSAILGFGADNDVTLTHVADTALLLNSSRQLQFGDSGTYIHQSADGVLDLVSDSEIEINATTIDMNGAIDASSTITAAGRVIVDDTTEATSTTDGSLQTDGGLSVAKSAVIGDDLDLLSDGAIFAMGAGQDVKITHDGGTGATLASAGAFLIDGAAAVSIDGASGVNIGTNDSGAAISIGHTTSEVTVNDNLTVTGDLTVNGTTTTIDTTNLLVEDPLVVLAKNNAAAAVVDQGLIFMRAGSNQAMIWDESADEFVFAATEESGSTAGNVTLGSYASLHVGALDADAASTIASLKVEDLTSGRIVLAGTGGEIEDSANFTFDGSTFRVIGAADITGNTTLNSVTSSNGFRMSGDGRLQFGDTGTFIHQSADGVLDLVSDSEIEINATTIDMNGAIDASSTITAAGRVIVDDATEATSTTDGSLQTDGGLSVAKSAVIGDDLDLLSDAAIVNFGADKDVTLTHVADTGLLLNSSRQLQFGDSATHIKQVADGQLELEADTSIQVDAPIVDFEDDGVILQFGADDDVTLMHSHNEGLLLNSDNRLMFGDTASYIHQSADGVLDLVSDTEIEINATTIDMNGTVDMSAGLTVGGSATLSSVAALTMAANDSTHFVLVQDSDDNIVKKESYQDLISGSAGLGLKVNATSKKLEVAAIEDHFMSSSAANGGKVFTLSATPVSGSVMVFINGIFQVQSGSHATIGAGDYAISGQTMTLVDANIVDAEDEVVVKYILA